MTIGISNMDNMLDDLLFKLENLAGVKTIVRVTLAASCVCLALMYSATGSDQITEEEQNSENGTAQEQTNQKKKKKKRPPPGPTGIPFFGVAFSADRKHMYKEFEKWKHQYGDILMTKMLGTNLVVLNSTEAIRKAFACDVISKFVSDRPNNFIGEVVMYNYKDVLLRRYDDELIRSKCLMMKALSKHSFGVKHFDDLASEEFKDVVSKFKSLEGTNIDPMEVLMPSFCKMIGMIFAGRRLSDDERLVQCIRDIDHYGDIMIQSSIHNTYTKFPWLRKCCGYYGILFGKVLEGRATLQSILINDMKKTRTEKIATCLVQELLTSQETDADWLTDEHINGFLMDLINTSMLTTKSVMAGMVFMWLHCPDVQRRIKEELDHVIGPNREPSVDDLKSSPYTHACIFELLRFQSHLPLTAAHANLSQEVELEGLTIPKGSVIFGNLWSAHHDETIYNKPWEFKPERFLADNNELVSHDHPARKNLIPFGVGKRACVGKDMAYNRMFLYTAHLLRNFEFRPIEGVPLPSFDPRMMTHASPVLLPPSYACTVVSR